MKNYGNPLKFRKFQFDTSIPVVTLFVVQLRYRYLFNKTIIFSEIPLNLEIVNIIILRPIVQFDYTCRNLIIPLFFFEKIL